MIILLKIKVYLNTSEKEGNNENILINRSVKKLQIKRGDIFYADLSPVIGSEQGGLRPVLIVQNDVGNKYSPTVIIAAIGGIFENNFFSSNCGCIATTTVRQRKTFEIVLYYAGFGEATDLCYLCK